MVDITRLGDKQGSCEGSTLTQDPARGRTVERAQAQAVGLNQQPSGVDQQPDSPKMPEQLAHYLGGDPWWMERMVSEIDKKPFDQSCHDKYDDHSKRVLQVHLQCCGIHTTINDDKYGIDLLGIDADYEVEVKKDWNSRFPYRTIHIPARKRRLLSGRSIFVILNNDLTRGCYIPNSALTNIVRKDTRAGTVKEEFFNIPLTAATFFPIQTPTAPFDRCPLVAPEKPLTLWNESSPLAASRVEQRYGNTDN